MDRFTIPKTSIKNPTLSCREPQAAHRHCPIQYPFPLLPYGGPGTSPGPGAIGAIELELAALGAPQWDIRCFQGIHDKTQMTWLVLT